MDKGVINYGQHFLTDYYVIRRLIEIAGVNNDCHVIEIGAGEGAVTRELCKLAKTVTAYEIDITLKPKLNQLLNEYKNLNVVYENFLDVDLKKADLIVSSLPFQILEPFIMKMIDVDFNSVVIIIGQTYAHSLFLEEFLVNNIKFTNLLTKCFFFINVYDDINSEAFNPKPKTISSIVELKKRSKLTLLSSQELYLMREIIEQRDKKIKNALLEGLIRFHRDRLTNANKNKAKEIIERLKIDDNILENYICKLSNKEIAKLYLVLKNNSVHV